MLLEPRDWFAGWQLARPWLQINTAFAGAVFPTAAVVAPIVSRLQRIMLGAGGLLLILAVLDSLDSHQDVLPLIVVALSGWGLIFAWSTIQRLQGGPPATRTHWVALVVGLVAIGVYLGAALWYEIIHLTVAPVLLDRHPLLALGLLIEFLLRWLGMDNALTGAVRSCPACGLRNIPARTTCKRCRARLGPVEHVAQRRTTPTDRRVAAPQA